MPKDYDGEFEYDVGSAVDNLIEQGWSKTRLAKMLREKARELCPPKPKKRIINPFKVTDKELSELPEDIQRQVRAIRRTAKICNGVLKKQGSL